MINRTLNECLSLIIDRRGVTPKKLNSDWHNNGYRVLSANNVKTNGLVNESEIRFIDEKTYKKWMKNEIQHGDLLLTSEAPAGEIMYWDSEEKIVAGQRLFILRVSRDINPLYLKYYIQSKKGQTEIKNKCSGSTVFGISAKTFDLIRVSLPQNKIIQDKIANLLYSIDKKIQNNNRTNKKLQEIMQTIYNYWFLQFEFPNQEGKPYKSSGRKMVWNKELKKEIPEGWKVENIIENTLSTVIKPGVNYFDKKNYLATANVDDTNIRDGEWTFFETRESRANMQPQKNSIWFAKMKNSKKHITLLNNCDWFIEKYILSTGFVGLQSDSNSIAYLHCLINDNNFELLKDKLAHGATQEAVNNEDLKNIKIVIPPKTYLKKFSKILNPILEKQNKNIRENQELASLRDFLLPLLISEQVSFKDEEN